MNTPIKIGVIGVGAMGTNHARVLSDMSGVSLVAVADTDPARAEYAARRFRVECYTNPLELLIREAPDAVTICVPTVCHHPLAMEAISRNINVLVEKPIAYSIEQGREMTTFAAQTGVILMVGHVERFNPAVIALRQRIVNGELGRLFQISAHRTSPFPPHVRDVGVVIDLAVHDLDVMRYVTGAEVIRIHAEIGHRVHATHEDQLTSLLRFSDDTIGSIRVNWLTPTKVRELTVTGEKGMFVVNYLTQDLTFFKNAAVEDYDWDTMRILRGVSEGPMIRHVVPKKEPLRVELEAFTTAISNGQEPIINGLDGIVALSLAEAIVQAGRDHHAIELGLFAQRLPVFVH